MSTPPATIAFAYDAVQRLRTATIVGVLTDEALVGAYRALVVTPDYDVGADDLVDMRGVTSMSVTSDGLRSLMGLFAEIDHLGVHTRLALVAPDDAVYGVSRMYQMLRGDGVPEEISVFRDVGAAHVWLAEGRERRGEIPPGTSAA